MSTRNSELTNEIISDDDYSDSESDSGSEDLADVKITREFQENVQKYVKIDDLIKKKQGEIKELKLKKTPCEKHILKFLEEVDENVIDISDGKLRKNKSTTKKKITEDVMKAAISEYVKDPIQVAAILESMESKRAEVTHVNLKRTAKRGPRKK